MVYKALDNIKAAKLDLLETASEISTTSTERKRRRERKLEIMKKEAELRKQKLRLEEDESIRIAEMNRKKCELDIDLDLLKQEQSASDDELSMERDLADIERERAQGNEHRSLWKTSLPILLMSRYPQLNRLMCYLKWPCL